MAGLAGRTAVAARFEIVVGAAEEIHFEKSLLNSSSLLVDAYKA